MPLKIDIKKNKKNWRYRKTSEWSSMNFFSYINFKNNSFFNSLPLENEIQGPGVSVSKIKRCLVDKFLKLKKNKDDLRKYIDWCFDKFQHSPKLRKPFGIGLLANSFWIELYLENDVDLTNKSVGRKIREN